jgi:ribosomal protein L37E
MTQYCGNCGAKLANVDYCTECGTEVSDQTETPEKKTTDISANTSPCQKCGTHISTDVMRCSECGYEPSKNTIRRWLGGLIALPTFLFTGIITAAIPVVFITEGGLPLSSVFTALILFGGLAFVSGMGLYYIYEAQSWKPTEEAPADWAQEYS